MNDYPCAVRALEHPESFNGTVEIEFISSGRTKVVITL